MNDWHCALELDQNRSVTGGSEKNLREAIHRGADLRIYTEFRHDEHLEPGSNNHEMVKEVSDFRVTYSVERRWVAGIMSLRMPITVPDGFGDRPSMSFFMYNEDGRQAIARPYLDGWPVTGELGPSPREDHRDMPKYHQHDGWDAGTNAPSSNFTYHFETFRYFVKDDWREVFSCASDGRVMDGSLEMLVKAFINGGEVKVAISGLCGDLGGTLDHELFVQTGPGYYCTERKFFCAGTHPVVRVKPGIPLRYESRGWDFGWLMPRTDGVVARWLCDPYTLKFTKSGRRYAIRWFVR